MLAGSPGPKEQAVPGICVLQGKEEPSQHFPGNQRSTPSLYSAVYSQSYYSLRLPVLSELIPLHFYVVHRVFPSVGLLLFRVNQLAHSVPLSKKKKSTDYKIVCILLYFVHIDRKMPRIDSNMLVTLPCG